MRNNPGYITGIEPRMSKPNNYLVKKRKKTMAHIQNAIILVQKRNTANLTESNIVYSHTGGSYNAGQQSNWSASVQTGYPQ